MGSLSFLRKDTPFGQTLQENEFTKKVIKSIFGFFIKGGIAAQYLFFYIYYESSVRLY